MKDQVIAVSAMNQAQTSVLNFRVTPVFLF